MSKNDQNLVWERPEPTPRPVPVALSRESIVQTALAIADTEGLASVTLRKVGGALGAGPMRLYGYLSTKEELLDLMVDAVYAEMLAGSHAATPWRDDVAAIAQAMRQAALRHPWFAELLGGRPHQGPNALTCLEAMLAALSKADLAGIDAVFQAAKVINAYLLGAIRSESSEALAERESGLTKQEWQGANWPYIERMIATGRFPTLAAVVRDARHPEPAIVFDHGLQCVLDGIEAQARRRI
jgi:AcrR family transcriptional regulator